MVSGHLSPYSREREYSSLQEKKTKTKSVRPRKTHNYHYLALCVYQPMEAGSGRLGLQWQWSFFLLHTQQPIVTLKNQPPYKVAGTKKTSPVIFSTLFGFRSSCWAAGSIEVYSTFKYIKRTLLKSRSSSWNTLLLYQEHYLSLINQPKVTVSQTREYT